MAKDDHTGVLKCEGRIKRLTADLPSWWFTCGEAYLSHPQSGHASWCREHDGECERKLVDTKVESESEEGH